MRRVSVVLALLLLAGCGGLLSRKQTSRFFSLDRIPPLTPVGSVSGAPIAVEVVELPPGFDRRDIVVRKADHQLEVREREQWSASLEPLVLHTLAFDLAARLPEGMVILPGQPIPTGSKRGISVIVETLAAGPENAVTLDARWTAGHGSHREQIRIDIPSLDGANIADGVSRAVATLADRIVAALSSPAS